MAYKTEDLALQIKQARDRAGLSQRDLSAQSGITQAHISQIESGKLNPGLATVVDIGRALDMELVLIPKRLMPAVNSLIDTGPTRRGLSPETGSAALQKISRGERLVIKHKHLYGPSVELDRMAEYMQFLKRVSLRPDEIDTIVDVIDTLNTYQASPQSNEIIKDAVRRLQHLRNRVAHEEAAEPRSAYSLDEDDDA
jgi:transcriptional regulator with XRE-family HTH domain